MALVKCGKCNRDISDEASSCPHCGARMDFDAVTTREDVPIAGVMVFVALIGYLVGRLACRSKGGRP